MRVDAARATAYEGACEEERKVRDLIRGERRVYERRFERERLAVLSDPKNCNKLLSRR